MQWYASNKHLKNSLTYQKIEMFLIEISYFTTIKPIL